MLIKLRKAQSTAEYAVLFGLIVGAVIAMQTYLKRSMQGKMKDSGDLITSISGDVTGSGDHLNTTQQYEPYYLAQQFSQTSGQQTSSDKSETLKNDQARDVSEDTSVDTALTHTVEQTYKNFENQN